ncbi:MAG: alanine racemase [Candidatus Binatia bacterium]
MQSTHGRPTVAEVSLGALRNNLREAQRLVGARVKVMAVVKADAYGHGAVAASRAFLEAGAAVLGTSNVGEAMELRQAGIRAPIVVLGGAFTGDEEDAAVHDLAVAVWSEDGVRAIAAAATRAGCRVKVHVKVDTGMTRLGLDVGDVRGFGDALGDVPQVEAAGVFSHFATADAVDAAPAQAQIACFSDAVAALGAARIRPEHVHLANSAAVLSQPPAHFTLVRPGIMLYGYAPAPHLAPRAKLKPALRLRTAVAQVRRVPAGRPVGYGGTYVTSRPSAIATLPIGYADGLHRLASNRGWMVVRGARVPVAGRVCMDHVMLDVTDVPGVVAGDEVVVIGEQERARVGADELAGWCETISYEMLTSVAKRVPRIYVEDFDA